MAGGNFNGPILTGDTDFADGHVNGLECVINNSRRGDVGGLEAGLIEATWTEVNSGIPGLE